MPDSGLGKRSRSPDSPEGALTTYAAPQRAACSDSRLSPQPAAVRAEPAGQQPEGSASAESPEEQLQKEVADLRTQLAAAQQEAALATAASQGATQRLESACRHTSLAIEKLQSEFQMLDANNQRAWAMVVLLLAECEENRRLTASNSSRLEGRDAKIRQQADHLKKLKAQVASQETELHEKALSISRLELQQRQLSQLLTMVTAQPAAHPK
mmetsp:Transcript_4007/g.10313  ORF Transcript_4007/g.10313 Transcript_4007/m.10313 type:complete len:212 (-) Transcript_4007:513-1148(-)